MMRSMRIAAVLLTIIGACLIAGSLTLGYGTISRSSVTCGSAFSPNTSPATVADLTNAVEADASLATYNGASPIQDACSAARSDRKSLALTVLAPGALLVLAGVCVGFSTIVGSASRRTPVTV